MGKNSRPCSHPLRRITGRKRYGLPTTTTESVASLVVEDLVCEAETLYLSPHLSPPLLSPLFASVLPSNSKNVTSTVKESDTRELGAAIAARDDPDYDGCHCTLKSLHLANNVLGPAGCVVMSKSLEVCSPAIVIANLNFFACLFCFCACIYRSRPSCGPALVTALIGCLSSGTCTSRGSI